MEDWREIERSAATEDVVFVVGVPRSGTTALRATLERHPAFRPREPRSIETRIFVEPERVLDPLAAEAYRLRTFLLDDGEALRRLAHAARAAQEAGAGRLTWVRLFFGFAKQARGVRRLLEKTPRHLDHVEEIYEAFPRARILSCVRHPVDVYSSYRKKRILRERSGGLEERHRWLLQSAKGFARKYVRWVERMTELAEALPDAFRIVRYERLVAEPERELRAVLSFVHERFEPTLVDGQREERDAFGSPRPGRRLVPSRKDWREFLPVEDARRVEKHARRAMETLGYARRVG